MFFLLLLWWTAPALAEGFLCAGSQEVPTEEARPEGTAAKPTRIAASTTGTRRALVLFARFKGEPASPVPSWAADIFNLDLPGSFSHFYDTMSFGNLQVRGEVAPRVYESAQPASAYLSSSRTQRGNFGQFSLEILRQADQDIDFSQYDNDGSDGVPNSRDDDGVVDAVFIVLDRIPTGFLLGEATGVTGLGFAEVFLSSDTRAKGKAIQIFPGQGTIQQGRFFAEAVGSMCHEYGHVLGLPDLYNTDFLSKKEAGPEEDSAGVGAWCLMGWGASGWNENDGPNSLCAWSRMKLGWSPVVSLSHEHETIALKDVGQGGEIYNLPVNDRETFLVEYRRRDGNYYDRHIPGEGVLIWHVIQRPLVEMRGALQLIDLECADGRWQDAGYPQGSQADSERGSDNLDFWAHDAEYTQTHQGNLGDATDPFDGIRFTDFTPQTNPSSHSEDGEPSVRIEHIHIEGGIAHLEIQTSPRRLVVENLRTIDTSGNGFVGVGEEVKLLFWVANRGGVNVSDIRAVLSTDDPLVEILQGDTPFSDLEVGRTDVGYVAGDQGFPRFRVVGDFAGTHTASLHLDLYAGSEQIGQHTFTVTVGAARQVVQEIGLIDSSGNRDGQAQAGEIVKLSIALADQHEAVLPALGFLVRSLDPRVLELGSPTMLFRMEEGALARSAKGPEFLLSSTLESGTKLPFELAVNGVLGAWKDTVFVTVYAGGDQTPPRINLLRTQARANGDLDIFLAERWIADGSGLRTARAIFYTSQDTSQVAVIPLEKREGDFVGTWRSAPVGSYLVAGEVEDVAGNRGRSSLLRVLAASGNGGQDSSLVGNQIWESVPISSEQSIAAVARIAIAPSNPEILYAAGLTSLWRSEDGGQTWGKTGLMFNGLFNLARLFVDPYDLDTVYLTEYGQILKSRDGGQHWIPVPMPDQDFNATLLAADAVLPGRIYGYSQARFLISEDEGQSWSESGVRGYPNVVVTHPAAPQNIYVGVWESGKNGSLWHSNNGGKSWVEVKLDHQVRAISPDPRDPESLYGAGNRTVLYSANQGSTWQDIGLGIDGEITGVQAHPLEAVVVYAWGGAKLWVSRDSGSTWKSTGLPGKVIQVALDSGDPGRCFLILQIKDKFTLWASSAFDAELAQVEIYLDDTPAGAMTFNPSGKLFVASTEEDESGIFARVSGNNTWSWQPSPALYGLVTYFNMLYVDPARPEIMIAHYALGWNQFARSVDGGNTWGKTDSKGGTTGSAIGAPLRAFPQVVPDPQQPGVYYLAGLQVWHTTDFGETWEKRGNLPVDNVAFKFFGEPPVSGLIVNPLDRTTLYAAKGDVVWLSESPDQKWIRIGQVQPGEVILALVSPPVAGAGMYAATEGGLYLSEDLAQTWKVLFKPEGIRWTSVQLRFDPRNPSHLFLVTSRYLYESSDAGQSWVEVGKDIAGFPWFNDLAFDPFDASVVYVTTTWGVYKLDRSPVITAVEEISTTPTTFSLVPNYPNPFNPTTTIRFTLPQAGETELTIYNLLGQRVATLVRGVQEAGSHMLQWDGQDDAGHELASGIYLCRLQAGAQTETRKVLLLR